MKAKHLLPIVLLGLASVSHAQESASTKFRGLSIGMSKDDASRIKFENHLVPVVLKGSNAVYLWRKDAPTLSEAPFGKPADDQWFKDMEAFYAGNCAILVFDANGRIKGLDLKKCFFNADAMSFDEFVLQVEGNYQLRGRSCNQMFCTLSSRNGDELIMVVRGRDGGSPDTLSISRRSDQKTPIGPTFN